VSIPSVPTYDALTLQELPRHTDDGLPIEFDPNRRGSGALAPGHTLNLTRRKRERTLLRDSFREVWQTTGGTELALERAAFAVGCRPEQIPEEAKATLQTLTAWVFAMRGLMGSTEHFKEIGDRVDPKPKRIEIEGAIGLRRIGAGSSADPNEAQAANDYYATLANEVVDAEYTVNDDAMDFLD
jgi:hypothetical protein